MKISKYFFLLILILSLFFSSCKHNNDKVIIALSKTKSIESGTYIDWLKNINSNLVFVNMYGLSVDSAVFILQNCDGLLVTGGEDVNPDWYGQISDTTQCEAIDYYRDSLEIALIKKAINIKMPLLGICRGEQIINVALGGSLFCDIPTDIDTFVVHRNNSWECYHSVRLKEESFLSQIIHTKNNTVNSYHHQAVNKIAKDLKVSALSQNDVVEAIEWKNPENKGFLLAVQWHPEHLLEYNEDMSLPIAMNFTNSVVKYHYSK